MSSPSRFTPDRAHASTRRGSASSCSPRCRHLAAHRATRPRIRSAEAATRAPTSPEDEACPVPNPLAQRRSSPHQRTAAGADPHARRGSDAEPINASIRYRRQTRPMPVPEPRADGDGDAAAPLRQRRATDRTESRARTGEEAHLASAEPLPSRTTSHGDSDAHRVNDEPLTEPNPTPAQAKSSLRQRRAAAMPNLLARRPRRHLADGAEATA